MDLPSCKGHPCAVLSANYTTYFRIKSDSKVTDYATKNAKFTPFYLYHKLLCESDMVVFFIPYASTQQRFT